MNEQFPGLVVTYIGPNPAHRTFRAATANAKALAYVLASNDATVLRGFLAQADAARSKSRDGNFAIGVGGRSTTTSIQLAIHLTGNEISLVAAEPGGFVSQALGLVYREVYRVFESFLVDLFEEIAVRDKRVLFSGQTITHEEALRATDGSDVHRLIVNKRKSELTHVGFSGIEKVYADLGLTIVPMVEPPPMKEQEDTRRRLITLSAVRNVIEHNRSIVNSEFLKLVPASPYKLGDRIAVASPELGDALSAVEWTADQLNQRAIDKFGIAGS